MPGPDHRKSDAGAHVDVAGPAIVLVRPQLGQNIGTAARAMLNCGLADLRLVAPRDGWPNVKALNAASGADEVLNRVRVFHTVADATADAHMVYATTARPREMIKPVVTPRQAAADMMAGAAGGARAAVIFGPERTGLNNEELVAADAIVQVPLNPAFASLNLAQAVLIVAYEWRVGVVDAPALELPLRQTSWANKGEVESFFRHLESTLETHGFYPTPEMRPKMARNMRAMFERMQLTRQDVQTLFGMVRALAEPRRPRGDADG